MSGSLLLINKPNDTSSDVILQNLLEQYNILPTFNKLTSESPLPTTFKPYIKHLPGEFHISKKGRVLPHNSLKTVLETTVGDEGEEGTHNIQFNLLNEEQLSAFILRDGGYSRKRHKKRKHKGQDGIEVNQSSNKRKREHKNKKGKKKNSDQQTGVIVEDKTKQEIKVDGDAVMVDT